MTDTAREAAQNWRCTSTNPNAPGNRCWLPADQHCQDATNDWDLHQDDEGNQW